MSLVGNLEDLGLGEILQIVSLSRKSGILSLQWQGKEGKIYIREGQVIRATSNSRRENLGEVLIRKGLADLDQIKQALKLQKKGRGERRLGAILAEKFGIAPEAIEAAVKEQIEKIVYCFFAWPEGTFSFALGEPEEMGETSFNPLQFMLDQGLNPQWLAMEGSRLLDEKRHRGESLEEEDAEPPLAGLEELLVEAVAAGSAPAAASESSQPSQGVPSGTVFLVDDDTVTRQELGRVLEELGLTTRLFPGSEEMMAGLEEAAASGEEPMVLIDLIMPRADGSGILGGLELLGEVRERFPELPAMMMTDHPNPEAEQKARALGVDGILGKPKKSDIRKESGAGALRELAGKVAARMTRPVPLAAAAAPAQQASAMFNLGVEMRKEFGEADAGSGQPKGPESPGLYLLRGMLAELQNPVLGGGIILLVLRFASELMNRAVIFAVKDDEVVGLGQFGIESEGESADVRIRRMQVPRGEGTIFDSLLKEMAPARVKLGRSPWDSYLREELGGGVPEEVFLGPIVSEGKVVAILYGDNLPGKKEIGDTESLEIFLSQAGLAMEKALLERRLRSKEEH